MNRAALSTLIAQLGGVPSVERMAILQEVLDALVDRIESLEVQVRSAKLQARPWQHYGLSAATQRREVKRMISATGGKSVTRTPVKKTKGSTSGVVKVR